MVKMKGKKETENQRKHFLKRKKRQLMSASNGTEGGYT